MKTLEEKRKYQREYMRKYRNSTGCGSGGNQNGTDNHNWKDGNRAFGLRMAPKYFKQVRYCERCDKDLLNSKPAERAVHHKDHDRSNNVESNFELLCKRCHQIEHKCWLNLPESSTTISQESTPK